MKNWTPPYKVTRSTIRNRAKYGRDLCADAIVYLKKAAGKPVSNKELAEALSADPRGLRQALRKHKEITINLVCVNPGKRHDRQTPFYSITPEQFPALSFTYSLGNIT